MGTCVASAGLSQEGEASGSTTSLETNVDAGTEITVTRTADGEQRVIPLPDGALLGGGLPGPETPPLFLDAGTFRIQSDGGADVGAYQLDVDFPAAVVWANRDDLARVSRSGFDARWQGGTAGQTIALLGTSSNGIERADASFACTVDATAGSFRVPDYALANLPNGRVFEDGLLMLLSLSELAPLNAPGVSAGSVSLTSMDYRTTFFRD